jgi:5-methylcytosine-specific restriction endonuclease McrA
LADAVSKSTSIRQVLIALGLAGVGGNYRSVQNAFVRHGISTSHFLGHAWNKGGRGHRRPKHPLESILVAGSSFPSNKLKARLYKAGLKEARCELCGWAQRAPDGRLPLELDHINGDREDNRIENLRILCPNCHSLQPTHRGLNIRRAG